MINVLTDKFVMWGLGNRGRQLYQYLPAGRIVAVIDSSSKFAKKWNGIPVISFENYLLYYQSFPLVITPALHGDILSTVSKSNIHNYCTLDSALIPSMMDNYFDGDIQDCNVIAKTVRNAKNPVIFNDIEDIYTRWERFCHNKLFRVEVNGELPVGTDVIIVHGLSIFFFIAGIFRYFYSDKVSVYFTEDGFLHSVVPINYSGVDSRFRFGHSIVLDYHGLYLNGRAPSVLEYMLNSEMVLSNEQIERAKTLIKLIIDNKLSKYNHQPLVMPNNKFEGRKRVLVIDQVWGDQSIGFGLASDELTFREMLDAAISENPDADILIKRHPASKKGHYNDIPAKDNIYVFEESVNPIVLLSSIDAVYVCTSQLGFEAVLCGKEVHVFGMPFYAGWGVTKDRIHCQRRTHKRSKEEIFYIAYILYSHYLSCKTNKECTIEEAIDELIELRDEYFKNYN